MCAHEHHMDNTHTHIKQRTPQNGKYESNSRSSEWMTFELQERYNRRVDTHTVAKSHIVSHTIDTCIRWY